MSDFVKKELVDNRTGEVKVIMTRPDVPFRSITDLKGYENPEWFEPDSSMTEPGQDVNIASLAQRCLRGEIVSSRQGNYDINPGMTAEEAFATTDVTQSEGFDLADVTAISEDIGERLKSSDKKEDLSTTSGSGAANLKASDANASAVGKSDENQKDLA